MHSNADSQELARFSDVAPRWWDADGPMRPLHELNPLRLAFVAQRQSLQGSLIADIGCGGGILSESLARAGARVTAVDLAEDAIAVAQMHALEAGLSIDYRLQSAEALAELEPASFDAVTCMEMLEHVPDPVAVLGACSRLLKPGGRLFVSTLSRTAKAFALGIVGAEYVLGLLPRGTHRYERFIRPSELRRALVSLGLIDLEFSGLSYDPFTRQARLVDDLSVNYLVAARLADA
jgi:2-polyprenyl-6-hydroxyphenyl methylase/3-demethylubiquinone-9 3-methyltransferase